MAMSVDCKIFKLLGNHELLNINEDSNATNYICPKTLSIDNYYRGQSRANIFKVGNIGYKLLFENGCGLILIINKIIFVHAQLPMEYNFQIYDHINKEINKSSIDQRNFQLFSDILKLTDLKNSLLWGRNYGNDEIIKDRINNVYAKDHFCNYVLRDIKNFLVDTPFGDINPKDFKIIIGHCIQSYSTWYNTINSTFSNKTVSNNIIDVFEPPIMTGNADLSNNIIFGITMECPNEAGTDNLIYKVDIGSSRGFDQPAIQGQLLLPDYNNGKTYSLEMYKKLVHSRTPQVLVISNRNIKIIKSSIINTRIHQYRYNLENDISRTPDDNVLNVFNKGENKCIKEGPLTYYKKYLKYKNKYLALKNNK